MSSRLGRKEDRHRRQRSFFADCGVIPDPRPSSSVTLRSRRRLIRAPSDQRHPARCDASYSSKSHSQHPAIVKDASAPPNSPGQGAGRRAADGDRGRTAGRRRPRHGDRRGQADCRPGGGHANVVDFSRHSTADQNIAFKAHSSFWPCQYLRSKSSSVSAGRGRDQPWRQLRTMFFAGGRGRRCPGDRPAACSTAHRRSPSALPTGSLQNGFAILG